MFVGRPDASGRYPMPLKSNRPASAFAATGRKFNLSRLSGIELASSTHDYAATSLCCQAESVGEFTTRSEHPEASGCHR
jgi:hypothetical protein